MWKLTSISYDIVQYQNVLHNENAEVLELKIHTDHGSFNKSMKFVKW